MNKKTVMAMPLVSFWAVVAVCVLGIVLGSFWVFRSVKTQRFLKNGPQRCDPFPIHSPFPKRSFLYFSNSSLLQKIM